MSTEPYPEVTGDESAIVPPPERRGPEWPKKIRTLTATELDRLTIDSAGRFYWDNKLVNYEPPDSPTSSEPKSAEATERSAMEIIDRAVHDLGDRKTPPAIEGAELPPRPVRPSLARDREETAAVDLDVARQSADVAQLEELEAAISPIRGYRTDSRSAVALAIGGRGDRGTGHRGWRHGASPLSVW